MKWRRISEEEVRVTIDHPDTIEESVNGRINVYKNVGVKYIKVTYRAGKDKILVISVVEKRKEI